jgi:hypothetical protein
MKSNTTTALKKTNPSDLPVDYLKQLRIERFGQDWVKYCENVFEGGYQAVHKRLSTALVKDNIVHKAAFKTTRNLVQNRCPVCQEVSPVQRSLDVLSKGLDVLTWKQRSFLCSVISYGRMSLTEKQEIWLAALEKRVN